MHEKFLNLAITIKLLPRLASVSRTTSASATGSTICCHAKALEVMRHLRLDTVCVEVPEAAMAFLHDILAFWRSLALEEQQATPWMHEPGGGGRAAKAASTEAMALRKAPGARHSRPSRPTQPLRAGPRYASTLHRPI
jgi:hypothetical protein